jgi:hypothetical protein
MGKTSWAQQSVNNFYKGRKLPTQDQCEQIARSISDASEVYNIDTLGSMSYTVVCTGRQVAHQALIVSFREPEAHIDQSMGE